MNKKALSTIVATLLLILMGMLAAGVLWMAISNLTKPDTLLSPQKCFEMQSYKPLNIQKVCYNSERQDLVVTLTKSSYYSTMNIPIDSLEFVIDSQSFICSNSCPNCNIPMQNEQTKEYFFQFQEGKPQEISLSINNCFIEKRNIENC